MRFMPRSPCGLLGTLALVLGLVWLTAAAAPVQAQDRVNIRFAPGKTSTTVNGTVRGYGYIDYILNVRGGQTMVVSLAVTGANDNGTAYFNILPARQDYGGIYTGHMDNDRRAEVSVPRSGDWAIRVYLMGNDRDTDRTVGYSMDVYIPPLQGSGTTKPKPPAKPPVAGNIVTVTGVPSNDV